MSIGERLKALRLARGWTQEALWRKSSISINTIADHEQGRCEPNLATLRRYAIAFGISLSTLLENVTLDTWLHSVV